MTAVPAILTGLREIAGEYDALICDVWGVLHDGVRAFPAAVEALRRYRATGGRIVLLTNAPRPTAFVEPQMQNYGVPADCYDCLVTSGGAAREDLVRRSAKESLAVVHLGPKRDRPLYEGLNIAVTAAEAADLVLCTGLFDDEVETPEDYREVLGQLAARGLPMICANPDVLVPRGGKLVYCAGALAQLYESLGGAVAYYGKPHPPIYAVALEAAGNPVRPLVVGDGLFTDIRGANLMGMDALFVAMGVHAKEVGAFTAANVAALLGTHGMSARAAVEVLAW